MDNRLVEFAALLRQNGVRVSIAETVDAARAATEVGFENRALFKSALRATLTKREADIPAFERAFEFFFTGTATTFDALDEAMLKGLEEQGLLEDDELAAVVATVNRLFNQMSALAQATLRGDRARLAQIFRGAALQLDLSRLESSLQTGFFSRRLLSGAGLDRANADFQALERELVAAGVSEQGVQTVSHLLRDALRRVEEAARREITRQAQARLRQKGGGLADRPFHTLSRAEIEKTQTAVRKLADKLKSRIIRKQRNRRRGVLNVRRTLRKNLTWEGVPMSPAFRRRRPERPDVIVLCDVSDSVRNASRMMLLFMYTLQALFTRVRSFVFVSDLGEVTALFKEADVEQAVDLALAGKTISLHSNSNYGRALATFGRDFLGSVGRRTTVMIIGDGRNNYNATNVGVLRDLRRKCKRLLWICSEDRQNWGFGDSEMHAYAKPCHQVFVVQTLTELERVANELIPG